MAYENTPLNWENEGTEPSEDLKTNGFEAGMKPAADTFNYFLNNTGNCISELQTKVGDISDLTTTAKTSLVAATNAINQGLNSNTAAIATKAITNTYTATLTSSGWSSIAPYTQTVTVTGILTTDNPVIDVVLSTTTSTALNQLEAWGNVSKIVTGANSITATCLEDKPEVDIPIQIKVVR